MMEIKRLLVEALSIEEDNLEDEDDEPRSSNQVRNSGLQVIGVCLLKWQN